MNIDTTEEEDVEKEHFYSTVITHYKVESMSEENIVKAKEFLNNIDGNETNAEHLQHKLEEMVTKFCEPREEDKSLKDDGTAYRSNNLIPRHVRKWLTQKSLSSKALLKVKTAKGCRRLKEKIIEAEQELSKEYFKRKVVKENEAIKKMELNPKYFFTYVKKLNKSKGKVGPFVNEKGDIIDKEAAETLQDQYKSVWSIPREDLLIKDREKFFSDPDTDAKPVIKFIHFTEQKIRKAIMKLKNGKAPGPDGIPSELLKTFCDEMIAPLTIIYLDSLETGVFPAIWKKMFISPIKKCGKSKSKPESFRPLALTSIIGKVMEMIVT